MESCVSMNFLCGLHADSRPRRVHLSHAGGNPVIAHSPLPSTECPLDMSQPCFRSASFSPKVAPCASCTALQSGHQGVHRKVTTCHAQTFKTRCRCLSACCTCLPSMLIRRLLHVTCLKLHPYQNCRPPCDASLIGASWLLSFWAHMLCLAEELPQ